MTTSKTTTDFTEGNIYSEFLTLAAPLILGNILQQFYNTIDAFVVGKFAGTKEFAAIGIAGTIMNLFLFILIGACSGLSVLFARFYGTRDYSMLQKQHFTALTLGLFFSIALGASGLLCMHPLLAAIRTPAELTGYVSVYLRFIFLSLPAAFLYNLYASALRASGDTKTAFFILAAAVFTNLVLDIVLVAYKKQGIFGAAAATACTQILSATLCFFYLAHSHKEFLFSRKECTFDWSLMKLTMQYSFATALHQASLYIGKLLVQGIVNSAGTAAISAYTAATRIEGFANSFGDSGSAASSVLISQNYGAKKTKRIQEAFRKSLFVTAVAAATGIGWICANLFWLAKFRRIRYS